MNSGYLDFILSGKNDCDFCEESDNRNSTDGFFAIKTGDFCFYCIMIIGQVEGHYLLPSNSKTTKYEHVIPRIIAVENDDSIDGLLLILNTVGGDIEAGLAISELVAGMSKPTSSLVIGGGHSIGIPLAVSAKKSFIAKTATMTVHPVRMNGLVLGAPQTFNYFNNIQERIVSFVCSNSSISPEKFRSLILNSGELVTDLGTVLSGEEAVDAGIINSIGGITEALDSLKTQIADKNV